MPSMQGRSCAKTSYDPYSSSPSKSLSQIRNEAIYDRISEEPFTNIFTVWAARPFRREYTCASLGHEGFPGSKVAHWVRLYALPCRVETRRGNKKALQYMLCWSSAWTWQSCTYFQGHNAKTAEQRVLWRSTTIPAGVLLAILHSGSKGQHMFPGKSAQEGDKRCNVATTKLCISIR